MSKHTAGPFKVEITKHPSGKVIIGIGNGGKHWIAKLAEHTTRPFEEDLANAHVLAAAAEMALGMTVICAGGAVLSACLYLILS